ncbi:MAG: hypothetical protein Q9168_004020 [Polycauliona sp. 1 TL-2023]
MTSCGLYRGLKARVTDAFDLYHQVQEIREPRGTFNGPALPALGHATAGSIGAAISNVVTYPFALIVTRLQIQRSLRKGKSGSTEGEYRSLQDAAQKIYKDEGGLPGFYAGIGPDTAKTIADSFLFFLAYNFLRQARLRARGGSTKYLPVADELGVGFFAGAFSKLLTTPIANIVTRQQAASMMSSTQSNRHSSIRETASQIRHEKGLQGFWSGYSASLVLTLNPSLTFFLFEFLKRLLVPRDRRSDPPAQATFLIAAVSKAVASTITYPFSMAKSRAQASSKSVNERAANGIGNDDEKQEKMDLGAEMIEPQKPRNVFSTILQIAKAEGPSALYEGLGGEVLKGFFSHGFTMIVKQMVHRFIIQLYYATLRLSKRLPSPEVVVESSKERTTQALATVQKDVEPLMSSTTEKMQNASSTLLDGSQDALEKIQKSAAPMKSSTTEKLKHVSSNLRDSRQDALKRVQLQADSVSTAIKQNASSVQDRIADILERTKDQFPSVKKGDEG